MPADDPTLKRPESARDFFLEQGYQVARGLLDASLCTAVRETFKHKVKPSDQAFMRQTTTRPERHNFSEHGFMTNPMLDIHRIDAPEFIGFRDLALDVFCDSSLRLALQTLMNDAPVLVQTMYFESSRGTDAHMDSHFIDSREHGALIGAWIALEDIDALGGRFTVYPTSHKLLEPGAFPAEVTEAARAYEHQSLSVIRGYQLEKRKFSLKEVTKSRKQLLTLLDLSGLQPVAPNLGIGDVVFFAARTLHGSMRPGTRILQPGVHGEPGQARTRHSLTCHWVPRSKGLMRYLKVEDKLRPQPRNGTLVHTPAVAGGTN